MSVDNQPDQTPKWGVEILIAIERLDAKIGANDERHSNSSIWAERNIKDHEVRLRQLEQFRWLLVGIALASGSLTTLITQAMTGA